MLDFYNILAVATLVLEAPEAVPVGRNATYQCCTSVEGNEVKWAVQTPDGSYYDEADLSVSIYTNMGFTCTFLLYMCMHVILCSLTST